MTWPGFGFNQEAVMAKDQDLRGKDGLFNPVTEKDDLFPHVIDDEPHKHPHPDTGYHPKTDPQHREFYAEHIKADVKELHKGTEQKNPNVRPDSDLPPDMSRPIHKE
jgi:hypothetical protein